MLSGTAPGPGSTANTIWRRRPPRRTSASTNHSPSTHRAGRTRSCPSTVHRTGSPEPGSSRTPWIRDWRAAVSSRACRTPAPRTSTRADSVRPARLRPAGRMRACSTSNASQSMAGRGRTPRGGGPPGPCVDRHHRAIPPPTVAVESTHRQEQGRRHRGSWGSGYPIPPARSSDHRPGYRHPCPCLLHSTSSEPRPTSTGLSRNSVPEFIGRQKSAASEGLLRG